MGGNHRRKTHVVLKNPTSDWTITFTDEDGKSVKADELVYGKTYTATANPGSYVPNGTITYGWKYDSMYLEPVEISTTSMETNTTRSPDFKFTCTKAGNTVFGCLITINGYQISTMLGMTDAQENFTIQKADIPTSYFTAPTAKQDLFYKGKEQALVTAGTVNPDKFSGHVEYRLNETDNWSTDVPKGMNVGTYKVYWRIISGNAAYKNYEAADPITVSITNDWHPVNGTEFEAPATTDGWLKENPKVAPKTGYQISTTNTANGTWDRDGITIVDPDDSTEHTISFYVKNTDTGAISEKVEYTFKLDSNQENTRTTATVSFSNGDSWNGFTDNASFSKKFKDAVTVTVKAKDLGSGVATIEYVESNEALTLAQAMALTNWSVMSTAEGTDEDDNTIGTMTVSAVDGKRFAIYVRVTDNVGNVEYFSTNGATFDTVAPTITGVTDGETAYTTREVTIFDENLYLVNNEPATATTFELTLDGNVDKTYTIEAKDSAGNVTKFTVNMKSIASITSGLDGLTVDNVTSASKEALETAISTIQKEQANKNATESEKTKLKEQLDKVNALLKRLEDVEKACNTKNIQAVKDITAANVKLEDKSDLEKAKTDLNKALKDYDGNLTEDEKKALKNKIDTIDNALQALTKVEYVEGLIEALPKTITSKDSKAVKAAEDAYNALTEHEKTLVSSTSVKKLQAARKTLNRLNNDPTSPYTGDDSHVTLWFTMLLLSAAALVLLKKRKVVR